MNNNARPNEVGTGAVMPGGHGQRTATHGHNYPFHAEAAFVGALLHMPVPMAGQALDLIHDDDLADLLDQHIVAVVRRLVAESTTPDPVAVLSRARTDGDVAGTQATQAMAMRLSDLYVAVPTTANWRVYGMAVIDEALRRRCVEMAGRVAQAAEGCPLDVLVDVLNAECRLVGRLHDRRVAAEGGASPAPLRSVVSA